MAYRYDTVRRLEPTPDFRDLNAGIAATIADPVWFLGRRWSLCEDLGSDRGSPVWVEFRTTTVPIDPAADADRDPRLTPAEAIVEAEPGQFWTPGRRVGIGRRVAAAAEQAMQPIPTDDPALLLAGLPVPYDVLDATGPDGQALWARRADLGLDERWFPERPADDPTDAWDPAALWYDADLPAADTTLQLRRHDGGELDWYSVDAAAPIAAPPPPDPVVRRLATHLTYPGMPDPDSWQIEDVQHDIGAYPPDRAHVSTLLLIELLTAHNDDWFTFPNTATPGTVVLLSDVVVTDTFGGRWPLSYPTDGWSFFAVSGLGPGALVLWPNAATPLEGPVLDQVDVATDEDSDLLWAIERRIAGREPGQPGLAAPRPPERVDTSRPHYAYRATTDVPRFWHPYVLDTGGNPPRRRLVQGRLADASGPATVLTPAPATNLLKDPAATGGDPVHQLDPSSIPVDGATIRRSANLGRRTDGRPVLWTQRRRVPLDAGPALVLRFDDIVIR